MKLATHPYFSSLTWNIRKMLDFGLFQKPVRCYIFIHPSRMNDEIFVRIIFGRQSLLFQKRYLIFIRKVSKLGTVKKVSAVHQFRIYTATTASSLLALFSTSSAPHCPPAMRYIYNIQSFALLPYLSPKNAVS